MHPLAPSTKVDYMNNLYALECYRMNETEAHKNNKLMDYDKYFRAEQGV